MRVHCVLNNAEIVPSFIATENIYTRAWHEIFNPLTLLDYSGVLLLWAFVFLGIISWIVNHIIVHLLFRKGVEMKMYARMLELFPNANPTVAI